MIDLRKFDASYSSNAQKFAYRFDRLKESILTFLPRYNSISIIDTETSTKLEYHLNRSPAKPETTNKNIAVATCTVLIHKFVYNTTTSSPLHTSIVEPRGIEEHTDLRDTFHSSYKSQKLIHWYHRLYVQDYMPLLAHKSVYPNLNGAAILTLLHVNLCPHTTLNSQL